MCNRLWRKGLSPIFQKMNVLGCRLSASLEPKSTRNLQCMVFGLRHMSFKADAASTVNTRARDTSYYSSKAQVEISPEKQKLAASLFGVSSKTGRHTSTTGHKAGKAGSHVAEKPQGSKGSDRSARKKTIAQPQPDLLDLGKATVPSSAQSYDSFKQLERLLASSQVILSVKNAAGTNKSPDIMGLRSETAGSGEVVLTSISYLGCQSQL